MSARNVTQDPEVTTAIEVPAEVIRAASAIAERNNWTTQQAVLFLLKRGLAAQNETEQAITRAYNAFMNATPENEGEAGDALIRSIFGPSALA